MPKTEESNRRDREDERIEAVLRARAEFAARFKRSRKGNLWRNHEGLTLTVFPREDDAGIYFAWVIKDEEGSRFSDIRYERCETEEDALSALASELGVGE